MMYFRNWTILAFALCASVFAAESPLEVPTVILIMTDGTRPDVVEELSKQGKLPNIQRYFMDGGSVVANSFTSLSLTVPSWTQILSGVDIDRSGIKGNDVFHRDTKDIDNFLDWRQDLFFPFHLRHGQAYRKIHGAGNSILPDRFSGDAKLDDEKLISDEFGPSDNVYMTFFPLNNQFPLRLFGTLPEHLLFLDQIGEVGLQGAALKFLLDYSAFQSFDRNSVNEAINVMYDKGLPKKRLIGIYMASVDHMTHWDSVKGKQALLEVDYEVGRIFKAIRETRYRDSLVFLLSDHGSLGGTVPKVDNFHNPLRGETYMVTATNVSELLTGSSYKPEYYDYGFNVETVYAREGKFSLKNLTELQVQPFQCTNVARRDYSLLTTCEDHHSEHPETITAGASSSETLSFPYAAKDSGDWKTPNNFYTLTHYQVGSQTKNLIRDLENYTVNTIAVYDPAVAKKIGNKPLDWLAVRIAREDFNRSKVSQDLHLGSDEDVVLIYQSAESQALILQKQEQGKQLYRYLPISDFDQKVDGEVSFSLNEDFRKLDPFNYLHSSFTHSDATGELIADSAWFAGFHEDREWAARYLHTAYPNSVFAIPRFAGFRGSMGPLQKEIGADIYLNPRYGHYFTVDNDAEEVEHGMWQKESVNHLFMATGPGIKQGYRAELPHLATDFVPTVFAAIRNYLRKTNPQFSGALPAFYVEPKESDLDGKAANEIFSE